MKPAFAVIAAATAVALSPAHAATPIAAFELNGSTANGGTTGTLTNNGATLTATRLAFGVNQGPTISGIPALAAYTIDLSFNFSSNGAYFKILDFSNLLADAGIYSLNNQLSFFPTGQTATAVFTPGTDSRLTLSRDALGTLRGYVDGTLVRSYDDSTTNYFRLSGQLLNFFQDDVATGRGEASAGSVDYIRIFDSALDPAGATPTTPPPVGGAVPEPATWMMMIGGFALVGGALRRRRVQVARVVFR